MANKTALGGTGEIFQGEDKVFQLTVQDTAGAAVDITGWTIEFDVRSSDVSAASLISGPVTCVITDAANGVCTATVADTVMDNLSGKNESFRTYRYAFKRQDAGVETVLAYGDFKVEKAAAN